MSILRLQIRKLDHLTKLFTVHSKTTFTDTKMHFLKATASSLVLGRLSHAWLLQFSDVNNCADVNQVEEKGGQTAQENRCMSLFTQNIVAMTVVNW